MISPGYILQVTAQHNWMSIKSASEAVQSVIGYELDANDRVEVIVGDEQILFLIRGESTNE